MMNTLEKETSFSLMTKKMKKELREYEQTLLTHGIIYREVIFTTPCGEEYVGIAFPKCFAK